MINICKIYVHGTYFGWKKYLGSSRPILIPILRLDPHRDRYWYWYHENVPGLILIPILYLIRILPGPCKKCSGLWIDTGTDTETQKKPRSRPILIPKGLVSAFSIRYWYSRLSLLHPPFRTIRHFLADPPPPWSLLYVVIFSHFYLLSSLFGRLPPLPLITFRHFFGWPPSPLEKWRHFCTAPQSIGRFILQHPGRIYHSFRRLFELILVWAFGW